MTDVQDFYRDTDESTKRSLNQAVFTKIRVLPEYNATTKRTTVRVVGSELTEPYRVLLADELTSTLGRVVDTELKKRSEEPADA